MSASNQQRGRKPPFLSKKNCPRYCVCAKRVLYYIQLLKKLNITHMKKQNDTFLNIGFSLIALIFVALLSFAIINTIDKERHCAESGGTYVTNAEYTNCIK